MFDPFYTTKGLGAGLGLANVLGILRAHYGSIQVQATIGTGTVIWIYLPMDESSTLPKSVSSVVENKTSGGTFRVLLVEDEERVRDITKRLLEDKANQVIAFESYTDFSTRLGEIDLNKIDVALVDLTLGDGDGVQVITLLRSIKPDLPVVLMSGYDGGASLSRLDHDANVAFLQKPFVTEELIRALSNACK